MKLLDQVRRKLRAGHYAYRTEQAYVHRIERVALETSSAKIPKIRDPPRPILPGSIDQGGHF